MEIKKKNDSREVEKSEKCKKTPSFCTCTDLSCPLNPANHDQGCTPCVAKNLRDKEIPSCFFKAVGYPKPTENWHFEDFAALVQAANESYNK